MSATIRKNIVGTVNKKTTNITMPTCKGTRTGGFNRVRGLKMTVNKTIFKGWCLFIGNFRVVPNIFFYDRIR